LTKLLFEDNKGQVWEFDLTKVQAKKRFRNIGKVDKIDTDIITFLEETGWKFIRKINGVLDFKAKVA